MRTFLLGWSAMLVALLLNGCETLGYLSKPDASFVGPMVERRDTLTATGYAVIDVQPSDIAAQRRLLAIRAAKLDAYRGLTEQVYGQYLDSTTTVADMVVRSDSFRARVEGVVYGANLVQIEPRGSDTYKSPCRSIKVSSMTSESCIWKEQSWRRVHNVTEHRGCVF